MPTRTLRPEDLAWLACPACLQPLVLARDTVLCVACGCRYPITDGIPVLIFPVSSADQR